MLSRALNLATVMLLIGGLAVAPARAQNLEAGKTPSQIFSGTCTACHKGARGLLRTVAPSSLPGFLRQHYTTSSEMASVLASYLISNGATDTRYGQPKGSKDARQEPAGEQGQLDRFGRPIRRPPTQEAARPDGDGRVPQAEPGRRNRLANPEAPDERGPDGRKLSAKQRLSKRGKPPEELARPDAPKADAPMGEAAKSDAMKDEKANAPKGEGSKPEEIPEDGKPESATLDAPKGDGPKSDIPVRADPVPAVTPTETSSGSETKPTAAAPAQAASPAEPAASTPASAANPEPQGASTPAAVPEVAASPPPPPPAAPAGPPAPPISQ